VPQQFLDVALADGTLRILDQPVMNTFPVEGVDAHQEGLLLPLLDLTKTDRALSIPALVL
jgi:hypothetical protein